MLLRPKKCYIFKKIYLFLCLKVIFDTLGSFWSKNSSDFGKVQFCPELSNFSRFYPVLATGEDFSTIVRLLYKPWFALYLLSIPPTIVIILHIIFSPFFARTIKLTRAGHGLSNIQWMQKYFSRCPL